MNNLNNKLVQEPQGNDENRYPDSDSNQTKRNYTKELNETTRIPGKKKACK
jgi:hypothetical protein